MSREPAEVFPLASFLADEMEARGWTTTDAAIRMGGAAAHQVSMDLLCLDLLMCVHEDTLLVGDHMFTALAKAFDVPEQFLRNLDEIWRKWPAKRVSFTPPEALFGPVSRRALIRLETPET